MLHALTCYTKLTHDGYLMLAAESRDEKGKKLLRTPFAFVYNGVSFANK
jgi:hypothetical protein